jgi:cytochrome c oxidase assembly protein subunit 15
LGCPDWPGCYGHITVPTTEAAQEKFPGAQVVPAKAWPEMIHRYAVGMVGLLLIGISLRSLVHYKKMPYSPLLPFFLIALFTFQALLGMWTVTLQLHPLVVMGHLLGGILITSCLFYAYLALKQQNQPILLMHHYDRVFRPWTKLAIVIVFLQIALGGWTASNYAAIACTDFPTCHGQWFVPLDFVHAFNLWAPIGPNYEGGLLDSVARTTIHVMHRLGALVSLLYVATLSFTIILKTQTAGLRRLGVWIVVLLFVQIFLGMFNVLLALPLPVAVAHNLVGVALLLSLIKLNFSLNPRAQMNLVTYA